MRISLKIISILIILAAIIALTGCEVNKVVSQENNDDLSPSTFTITFNSEFNNTDSATTMPDPISMTITSPTTNFETLPVPPTMSGYTFDGWWTGKNGTGNEFTTSTKFTSDTHVDYSMVVYANWIPDYKYTVTFDGDGATVAADPASKDVLPPATTVGSLPTPPAKTGNVFAGWYKETGGGGTEFTANTAVGANVTVYAKWSTDNLCAVTYNSQGGTAVATQYITCGTSVGTLPTAPTKKCSSFANWYTGVNGSGQPFNVSTIVDGNKRDTGGNLVDGDPETDGVQPVFEGKITVYANWTWSYTAPIGPFNIGDQGPSCVGKVFYITNNGYSGLEAAPPDWYAESGDPSVVWINGDPVEEELEGGLTETYQRTQTTLNGNTSTAIGTGLANTEAIMNQVDAVGGTTIPYAAKLCRDYTGGGKTNWFLPSRDELAQLYAKQDATRWGGFVDAYYWSSSEYNAKNAYAQQFFSGRQVESYKSYERFVRPVRAF